MTERTRTGKARSQDLAGGFFCAVGAFFAVSTVKAMGGSEPSNWFAGLMSWPVLELIHLLGAWPTLLLSLGVAVLGILLFLRTQAMGSGRPLAALAACAIGLAFLLGALDRGGFLGELFPNLIAGLGGRALSAALGLAVAWVGAALLPLSRPARESGAEAVQRIGLSARHDPAGVSSAEAALLVTDSRTSAPRAAPRPEAAPAREPTLRPFTPTTAAPKPGPVKPEPVKYVAPPNAPARAAAAPLSSPAPAPLARPLMPPAAPAASFESATLPVVPPTPSWESEEESEELDEERATEAELEAEATEPFAEEGEDEAQPISPATVSPATLAAELAHAFEDDELDEVRAEDDEDERELEPAPALADAPRAAWEQISLFDEEEEAEEELAEELPPAKALKVETPAFDFDGGSDRGSERGKAPAPAHEPEPPLEAAEDPFALEAAPVRAQERRAELASEPASEPASEREAELDDDREDDDQDEELAAEAEEATTLAPAPPPAPAPKARPAPAAQADFVIAPSAPAQKAEPVLATDEESERWGKLVFEAGCLIVEQKRVAVSMLERRFSIEFDEACLVLDELQAAGLIGPYIGGRTRDILLTREEWLAHAPHAS